MMEAVTTVDPEPCRHQPTILHEPPDAAVDAIVRAARDGRLILYVGAGLSVATPAAGPHGSMVADQLRPYAAELLGVTVDEVPELSLEALGDRVARDAPERLGNLKDRASTAHNFRDMEPNFGHEAAALLLREGLADIVSVNWDLAIETAGLRLDITIEGVSNAAQRQQLATTRYPLYKVHGCASRPQTLQLTQAEVDQPPRWATAEVQRALAGGKVVFIGLGTVGVYVSEPVEELIQLWTDEGATICVVDRDGPSEAWRNVLGDDVDDVCITSTADAFLDDLLRGVTIAALSHAEHSIRLIAEEESGWAQTMLDGCVAVRDALRSSTADAVLRWWRDGVRGLAPGQQFIFSDPGRQALMGVARIAGEDGGALVAQGTAGNLTLRSHRRYFEVFCRPGPGQTFKVVDQLARERVRRRREVGLYDDAGLITVVVHGVEGSFPAQTAPVDIAAQNDMSPNAAAGIEDGIVLVKAERLIAGEQAA